MAIRSILPIPAIHTVHFLPNSIKPAITTIFISFSAAFTLNLCESLNFDRKTFRTGNNNSMDMCFGGVDLCWINFLLPDRSIYP